MIKSPFAAVAEPISQNHASPAAREIMMSLHDISIRFRINHERPKSFQDTLVNLFHRRYNRSSEDFWALRDLSFDLARGETLGIIGQNGSGKSTALKLITRILEPTTGKIAVYGKVSALIELGAGFHPDLTGRENIYLNGSILGISRKEMKQKIGEIVEFSELERFIDTPVRHYSSGMYARLGFSVAVAVDPDILIIDEVLSVGDEGFQLKCVDRINDFHRRGKSIIIVSHDLPSMASMCDRLIWLQNGKVKEQGPAAAVARSYYQSLHVQSGPTAHHAAQAEKLTTKAHEPPVAVATPDASTVPFEVWLTIEDASENATSLIKSGKPFRVHVQLSRLLGLDEGGALEVELTLFSESGQELHRVVEPLSTATRDFALVYRALPLVEGDLSFRCQVHHADRKGLPITESRAEFHLYPNPESLPLMIDARWQEIGSSD